MENKFDFKICRDGVWLFQGTPITRLPMVKLFAGILKKDDQGRFWLATPVERGLIEVEDAPFVAVEMNVLGQGRDQVLTFRTNLDETVAAGKKNQIHVRFNETTGEPSPYIHLRDGLEAKMTRAVYNELLTTRVVNENGIFGVWSQNEFFQVSKDQP